MTGAPSGPPEDSKRFRRPRIRGDLVWSEQRDASGAVFVVKDPRADRYFRLDARSGRIAMGLDGSRTVAAPAEATSPEDEGFGPEEVEALLDELERMGLLEGSAPAGASPPGALRSSPLFLRLPLGDPNALLGRLARFAGPLFHPAFVVAGGVAIVVAAVLAAGNAGALRADAERLIAWPELLYLWIPVLAVIAVHELAHGVACRRFGGEVHDMGLVLYYFQPCAYCDVSDAWMIADRKRRLWVLGAGPFVEAVVWSAATFVWVASERGSAASLCAAGIAATSGIKTLVNLNPLLRFDGYYLLSDGLGIPNLRSRAFGRLFARLRGAEPEPVGRLERTVLLAYAPVALAFSAGMVAWFGTWAYGLSIDRLGGWGHLAFWTAAVLLLLPAVVSSARQRRSQPSASIRTAPR
jgi:putative peptide zinc metalloprotease protein